MTVQSDITAPEPIDRDVAIIMFIRAHIAESGYPPSVREIGDAVGLTSTSSVHARLQKLEKAGVIVRADKRSRAITLNKHLRPAA